MSAFLYAEYRIDYFQQVPRVLIQKFWNLKAVNLNCPLFYLNAVTLFWWAVVCTATHNCPKY